MLCRVDLIDPYTMPTLQKPFPSQLILYIIYNTFTFNLLIKLLLDLERSGIYAGARRRTIWFSDAAEEITER